MQTAFQPPVRPPLLVREGPPRVPSYLQVLPNRREERRILRRHLPQGTLLGCPSLCGLSALRNRGRVLGRSKAPEGEQVQKRPLGPEPPSESLRSGCSPGSGVPEEEGVLGGGAATCLGCCGTNAEEADGAGGGSSQGSGSTGGVGGGGAGTKPTRTCELALGNSSKLPIRGVCKRAPPYTSYRRPWEGLWDPLRPFLKDAVSAKPRSLCICAEAGLGCKDAETLTWPADRQGAGLDAPTQCPEAASRGSVPPQRASPGSLKQGETSVIPESRGSPRVPGPCELSRDLQGPSNVQKASGSWQGRRGVREVTGSACRPGWTAPATMQLSRPVRPGPPLCSPCWPLPE